MGSNLVEIRNHQFNNLRQQMRPVYAMLLNKRGAEIEDKKAILRSVLKTFFVRLREFRHLSQEQLAEAANLTLEEVEHFEDDSMEYRSDIAEAYAAVCKGHSELLILEDQIREFKDPGFFESRRSVAHSALKQAGIVMPGVDYANLNSGPARILSLNRSSIRSER